MITIRQNLLLLTSAATLTATGMASAMPPPHATCIFEGNTTITIGGPSLTCQTTLVTEIDCAGNMEIATIGFAPGDVICSDFFVGNLPWTGNAMSIIAGGANINTDPLGLGLPAMLDAASTVIAGGTLSGVGPASSTSVLCDINHNVNAPIAIPIHGAFSMTGATFDTTTSLENKGCFP